MDKESAVASKLGSSSVDASFQRSVRDGVERQQWDDLNSVSGSVTLSASKDRWICDLNGDGVFRVKEFPLNYESEPSYTKNYNSYPYNSSSFPQQYLCCENCGGPHENFQCQPMNQNFYEPNMCYNSLSFDFDQFQPPQFSVIHQPPQEISIQEIEDLKQQYLDGVKSLINSKYRDEIKIDELKGNFNRMSIEINKKEKLQQLEQVANLSTYPLKRFNSFCYDDDDEEDYTVVITPDFSIIESLIMENEHLDTIPETESDEFIKSSVENLVPIPNLNSTPKNDRFDTKSYLLESLLNRDTLMAFSPKFDSLLEEFSGELAHTDLISPGINEANCDPEEDIHLVKRLMYDNSSPLPPKDFNSENSDVIIKSFSLSYPR
nr:RNA-directed DNA polymerase, eukaryota, reverse transcriptase zinc-binding domain protein [Tanacetum cinerariifolium]